MDSSVFSFVGQIATVALIAVLIRRLFGASGKDLPRSRGNTHAYGVKWQIRLLGYASAVFCAFLLVINAQEDWASPSRWIFLLIFLLLVLAGLFLASGLVITDVDGITKKVLLWSRSIRWDEVTEVRLHSKRGVAIELRAGPRKLVVDSRFVALQHLLREVESRTALELGEKGKRSREKGEKESA